LTLFRRQVRLQVGYTGIFNFEKKCNKFLSNLVR